MVRLRGGDGVGSKSTVVHLQHYVPGLVLCLMSFALLADIKKT